MICSIHSDGSNPSSPTFARYAEYDMFYTKDIAMQVSIPFARYAEYDMFYTFPLFMLNIVMFARYAEYDMFYTIITL